MAALMPMPATPAAADEHTDLAADRSRLGQLLLPLRDNPLMLDLPAALAPIRNQRLERLINLPGRRPMAVTAMLIT